MLTSLSSSVIGLLTFALPSGRWIIEDDLHGLNGLAGWLAWVLAYNSTQLGK